MRWRVPLADVKLGNDEEMAVLAVLRSGWLTMGEITESFEDAFAEFVNADFAVAVSSCTAALHIACKSLGLGPGDEVILPSLTFVATANAVRYTGAKPIFADIAGLDDLTISVDHIENKITEKTRAIVVMHYAGYACDMPAIMGLAQKHGLYVIEDAAHAVGASLEGKPLGTWGDVGCFSFFSNKNLVTGEGGMLVTNHAELAAKAHRLRSHGMTTLTWDRYKGHSASYDVVDLGFNYRMDEIRAAIGLQQLHKLSGYNQKRRELVEYYRHRLKTTHSNLEVPFINHPGIHGAHIMPVLLPVGVDRNQVMEKLRQEGIQTSIHYPPIHQFSNFAHNTVSLPLTEQVSSRELTLPLFAHLTPELIEVVIYGLQSALQAELN